MAVECLTIMILLLLTSFVFLRSKKTTYALLTAILLIVPGVHFLMGIFGATLAGWWNLNLAPLLVGMDAVALMLSCVLIGIFSQRLSLPSRRRGFLIIACGYSIILTWVFIFYNIT